MEEYHACPKSENKFCPKVAPSLSSGTHFLGWVGSSRKCYEARQYLPPVKLVSLDLAPDITQVPSDNTQAHQTPPQTPQTHRQTHPQTHPQIDSGKWLYETRRPLNKILTPVQLYLALDITQVPSDNTQAHQTPPRHPRHTARHTPR